MLSRARTSTSISSFFYHFVVILYWHFSRSQCSVGDWSAIAPCSSGSQLLKLYVWGNIDPRLSPDAMKQYKKEKARRRDGRWWALVEEVVVARWVKGTTMR